MYIVGSSREAITAFQPESDGQNKTANQEMKRHVGLCQPLPRCLGGYTANGRVFWNVNASANTEGYPYLASKYDNPERALNQ